MAPVLDLRRRLKAAGDALDVCCVRELPSGALEFSSQWDRILEVGAIGPVTGDDLESAGAGLGRCRVIID